MRVKFQIGDKVRAARKFRDEAFQFSGMRRIVATERGLNPFGYILEGIDNVAYFSQDLQFFCGQHLNDECNLCQYRFRCYTIK